MKPQRLRKFQMPKRQTPKKSKQRAKAENWDFPSLAFVWPLAIGVWLFDEVA
jgi:hypothetical protein